MFFRKKAGVSWIIVFLGNPGAKFERTRHNVGFMAADYIAGKHKIKIDKLKFNALTNTVKLAGEHVLLMKPVTYMNLSGSAVKQAMGRYEVPLERVLVIADDCALDVGRIRIRTGGSDGGHNGLKDIIQKCGGENFPRIKIGIGKPPHPDYEMADWVLSRFGAAELKIIDEKISDAATAIEIIIRDGFQAAMNKFN